MGSRILNYVLLFVAGLIVGTVGTIAQQSTVSIFHVAFPWGDLVALLMVTCLLVGLRLVNDGRWHALWAAVGIVIPIGVFSLQSAGGSVLVPANSLGYLWIIGTVIVSIVVIAWPRPRPRRASAKTA